MVLAITAPSRLAAAAPPVGSIVEFPIPTAGVSSDLTVGPSGPVWFTGHSPARIGVANGATVKEYPTGSTYPEPSSIVTSADGAVWYTNFKNPCYDTPGGSQLSRRAADGTTMSWTFSFGMWRLAPGPDGNVWFTGCGKNGYDVIGFVAPAGAATVFTMTRQYEGPYFLTAGPDGNMWSAGVTSVFRVSPTGTIDRFPMPEEAFGQNALTWGPDGNLWLVAFGHGKLVRFTPEGVFTVWPLAGNPYDITTGPSGTMFVTRMQHDVNAISEVATDGSVVRTFPVPSSAAEPQSIVLGADGNVWFNEMGGNRIARLWAAQPQHTYGLYQANGFVPRLRVTRLGWSHRITSRGPLHLQVVSDDGLGLVDSPDLNVYGAHELVMSHAGSFGFHNAFEPGRHGTIEVPIVATLLGGGTTPTVQVTWGTAPIPTGLRVEVQVRKPGTTAWTLWRSVASGKTAVYTPKVGPGTYDFRSRLRMPGTPAATGWSPKASVDVPA
jgi:virginiamycin B lyase